jgi:ATP-dependent DNA ligase
LSGWVFEPEDLLRRVEKMGDLFAPLLTLRQNLLPGDQKPSTSAPRAAMHAKPLAPKRVQGRTASMGKASLLKFVEPMLLLKTDKLPQGEEWLYEIKLDGYRAISI